MSKNTVEQCSAARNRKEVRYERRDLSGNECMERRYKDLCQSYKCSAKVFTKPSGGLKNKLGSPDLMIFFTSTMSHKLVQSALSELKGTPTRIERCHTSSLSALRSILEKHAG